jgi:hypothetical protein
MARSSALSVRFEKHESVFGEAMNEIRLWLDSRKIQPSDFKTRTGDAAVVFDIRFAQEHEARLFGQAFS